MQINIIKKYNNLLDALNKERQEEATLHLEEIKTLSAKEREEKGRAICDLFKRKISLSLTGDYLYKFRKKTKEKFKETEIRVADQLIISRYNPTDASNPVGLVYEIGDDYIIVSSPVSLEGGKSAIYRLDLSVNDLTYQRLELALLKAKTQSHSKIQVIMQGYYSPFSKEEEINKTKLNQMQERAVSNCLSCNGFYIVQGPPGTGKTYAASFLVEELLKRDKKVLLAADSNAAVDNLCKKVIDRGMDLLRIGHPIRVNDDLMQNTLSYKVVEDYLYQNIKEAEIKLKDLKAKKKSLRKPSSKKTKGLKYSELYEMLKKRRHSKGISKRDLIEMKPYIKVQHKIEKLNEDIKEIREEIVSRLLKNSKIIAGTCSSLGSEFMEEMQFDFAIIDEASQASIPSTLIPILKSNRFALFGDHFQLPPVVISKEAKDLGLDESLISNLAKLYPFNMIMLERQYRMNSEISNLVSDMFYRSKLIADSSVSSGKIKKISSKHLSQKAIDFISHSFKERKAKDSNSYYNPKEKELVVEIVKELMHSQIKADDIAIISPYKAQSEILRKALKEIEIDTVDSFQGREKEIVIISLVRSNSYGSIGFLKDFRRLNVSISRAKKKLILVGDENLLREHELYQKLISKIK